MDTLQRYELLLLTVPEITQDEAKDIERQVTTLIKDHKGSVISFDRWGKYRLAYPIRKNEYGVYFLTRFDIPKLPTLSKDIQSLLRIRFDTIVMRNLLNTLDANAPTTYKRPRSLEEAPQEENSSILKNKKVEGLISAVDSLRSSRKKHSDDTTSDIEVGYDIDEDAQD
ncbi:MAG TPA: 30S ribosomal protein S6 [Candidatus Babeliales bacterium]|jgi:small subunit ribosomal protein S6|nr:30S ribosomal protein S6 [Candidatus Babeliales bacterium]